MSSKNNSWVQHVKKFRAAHPGMSYGEAMQKAKSTWKRQNGGGDMNDYRDDEIWEDDRVYDDSSDVVKGDWSADSLLNWLNQRGSGCRKGAKGRCVKYDGEDMDSCVRHEATGRCHDESLLRRRLNVRRSSDKQRAALERARSARQAKLAEAYRSYSPKRLSAVERSRAARQARLAKLAEQHAGAYSKKRSARRSNKRSASQRGSLFNLNQRAGAGHRKSSVRRASPKQRARLARLSQRGAGCGMWASKDE